VQSYGSWVRSRLEPKRAHFLGAGQLVREIYPYLEKQGRELTVHVRDQARLEWNAPARHLSERAFDHGALIVAAPMSAAEIQAWLGERVPEQIVDLRDNSDADRLTFARRTKIFVLRDIFAQIESTKAKLLPRLAQVDGEIRARAAKLASQSQVRPQGWDDLCA
jgi:glutamyl-tRNA reductase